MNPTVAPVIRRRRLWPRVLLAACLTTLVVLGAAAYSYLTLDGDAALLRREMVRVTGDDWKTTIQLSLGQATFAILRGGLSFAHDADILMARDALATVRQASVGVYQRRTGSRGWASEELMKATDARMQRRGWTRIVGVADIKDTVMIYLPKDAAEPDRICVAVINAKEMVVVSATLNPSALMDLIKHHAGGDLRLAWRG